MNTIDTSSASVQYRRGEKSNSSNNYLVTVINPPTVAEGLRDSPIPAIPASPAESCCLSSLQLDQELLLAPASLLLEDDDDDDDRLPLMLNRKWYMVVLCISVIACGGMNNVLGKIRAKPMGACSYFATTLNAVAYVIIYYILMTYRLRQGLIPVDQFEFIWKRRQTIQHSTDISRSDLGTPFIQSGAGTQHGSHIEPRSSYWSRFQTFSGALGAWKFFIVTGICDSLGNAGAIISQSFVPGPLFALMNQAALPATVLVSVILLHKKYTRLQVAAICFVLAGGITSLVPDLYHISLHGKNCTSSRTVKFCVVTALSTIPTALSIATKENVFKLYNKYSKKRIAELGGTVVEHRYSRRTNSKQSLDVFVLGFHESIFTLCLLPLGFPLNMLFGQFPFTTSVAYIKAGVSCFLGLSTPSAKLCHVVQGDETIQCEAFGCCRWAMAAYVPYLLVNLLLNIGVLLLVLNASAVVAFMTLKATLPVAIIVFAAIHWPLLNSADTHVSVYTIASLIIICFGIGVYRYATVRRRRNERKKREQRR